MQTEYISAFDVVLGVLWRFWPVWVALILVMGVSFTYRRKLGLYGQLFDSGVGIAGVFICLFWLFTAIFASTISPFDPLAQVSVMKDTLPGAIEPASKLVYYFGGDKLALEVNGVGRSYAELDDRTDRVAAGFTSLGLEPGDHVSLMMANSIENVEAWFGLQKAGIVEVMAVMIVKT